MKKQRNSNKLTTATSLDSAEKALKGRDNEVVAVTLDDENNFMLKASSLEITQTFGSETSKSAHMLLDQVANLSGLGDTSSTTTKINQLFALVKGIGPTGDVEAMLAAQMVATHTMAMDSAKRALLENQTFEGRQLNLNHSVKLMRAFTQQIETLNKNRGRGQQKMTVEHVHVNEGGQAVIGNVEKKRGGKNKNEQ